MGRVAALPVLALPILALLALATVLAATDARAADPRFPALTGRVVDEAGLLRPETESRIEARLARLETDTGAQLVLVTFADLQGREIEDYGYRLGRHWGIGRRQAQDGVMILVAPRERRARIEVGYGLEPVLTDALAAKIIHEDMLPAFRRGGFETGLTQGVDAVEAQLRMEPEAAVSRAETAPRPGAGAPVGPAVLVFLVFLFVFLGAARATERRRSDIRWRGSGGSSVRLWRGHVGPDDDRRDSSGRFRAGGGFGGGGASGRW